MKLFFSTTPRVKAVYPDSIDRIYKKLHKLPYELTEKYIEHAKCDELDSWSIEKKTQYNIDSTKAIASSDVCVFETSIPSLGVGHMLHHCISINKPVVAFFQGGRVPFMLDVENNSCVFPVEYDNINLEEELVFGIKMAVEEQKQIRLNVLISAEMNQHIGEVAKIKRMSKSGFIRWLVDNYKLSE
ncbi:MAG: hypothetical protein COY80_01950 [Candidatus Pacebacteria bacterium CG_4_10_14_0_8_um_filter_42_14]|nr:MAG: hypothetical protein COY80_01950 [Candidatus Pacebacteria bacterium CG_4_10_14_0_8_um_filter_42_14]